MRHIAAHLLILAAFLLSATLRIATAQDAPNEFIIDVGNYDSLAAHAHNCTFQIDGDFAVTVCGDGYFAIDDTADLINTNTAFKVQANLTIALVSGPKDLRLDQYLSVVDDPGQKLTVIKKNVVEALHIELDKEEAPGGLILGGHFSPDFVVFHILNQGQSFIQVHTSKQSLGVVAAFDSEAINYQVLDLVSTKDLFYVYSTIQTTDGLRELQMVQLAYSQEDSTWGTPAQRIYPLDSDQCSQILRVTESIIVSACPSTKTMSVIRRSSMQQIYKKTFDQSRIYFDQLFVLNHKFGNQAYIFYTMSSNLSHRIGLIEVLIDETKTDAEQVILDWGELAVPSNEDDPSNNIGQIKLGGGSQYLLTTFEYFNQIKGYTLCPYDQVIKSEGSTICNSITQEDAFLLNPFDAESTSCGSQVQGTNENRKLDFLCVPKTEDSVDAFMIAVLVTLAFSLVCCCASFGVFCKYRAKTNNAIDDMNNVADRVHDPAVAQRILEAQNKQKLTLISKVLSRKKYSQSKFKASQQSCAICVEDFLDKTMIRETPCEHIFHDHCVMKWVETKLDQPDCPFCRTAIPLMKPRS